MYEVDHSNKITKRIIGVESTWTMIYHNISECKKSKYEVVVELMGKTCNINKAIK